VVSALADSAAGLLDCQRHRLIALEQPNHLRGPTRELLTDAALLADCDLRPPQVVRLFEGREDVPLTVAEARSRLD